MVPFITALSNGSVGLDKALTARGRPSALGGHRHSDFSFPSHFLNLLSINISNINIINFIGLTFRIKEYLYCAGLRYFSDDARRLTYKTNQKPPFIAQGLLGF